MKKETKKKLIIGFVALAVLGMFLPDTPSQEVKKEEVKKTVKKESVKNLTNEAVTICRMIIESHLSTYSDIDFPFANRKVFKKGNQRYIIKDYVNFYDNGIKKKVYWHCDIRYKGGDEMDTNNWEMLNLEILK